MISFSEAIVHIQTNTSLSDKVVLPINDALNYVCAEDCCSSIDFPNFPQAAMDGYAIAYHDTCTTYNIVGELKAGDDASAISVQKGETIRIFTGAMIPQNTDCVIRQEDAKKHGEKVSFSEFPKVGANIRLVGEQIKQGVAAIKKGTILNPAAIGFLAMTGNSQITVYRKPKIAIITTGSELLPIAETLQPGKIYESNSYTLLAAFSNYGFSATHHAVEDSFSEIKKLYIRLEKENDLLVFTGGISVGDYDFVGKVLTECGVESVFYKVRQKPGKPIFFGKKDTTFTFALPGNPAAVLTSFYLYILPFLEKTTGRPTPFLSKQRVKLTGNYSKNKAMTHFLKGKYTVDHVQILSSQSSAMLNSFVDANCIIILQEGKETWLEGEYVDIMVI